MAGATRSIVINAPMEKIFGIITDYEKYTFLPEVKTVKILERKGSDVKVLYEANVVKLIKYTLWHQHDAPKKMTWSFVEGDFMRDNKGSWVLESAGEGKTQVTYNIEITLGPLVPKAIVNALVDSSLPKMLEGFKKRSESP